MPEQLSYNFLLQDQTQRNSNHLYIIVSYRYERNRMRDRFVTFSVQAQTTWNGGHFFVVSFKCVNQQNARTIVVAVFLTGSNKTECEAFLLILLQTGTNETECAIVWLGHSCSNFGHVGNVEKERSMATMIWRLVSMDSGCILGHS